MLSSTTKYAIKALLALKDRDTDNFIQVSTLARRSKVPGPYLAKIMKALTAHKIVSSRRGANGGVRLASDFEQLTLLDICTALGDPITSTNCVMGKTGCNTANPCVLHNSWSASKKSILKFLQESKLANL